MLTLKKFLTATKHKITGGAWFQWQCYGPHARFLDCGNFHDIGAAPYWICNAIFDTETQVVYEVCLVDYPSDADARAWRWINPDYKAKHKREAKKRGFRENQAWDDVNYLDLNDVDMLKQIRKTIAKHTAT